jgi:DNA-binding transcriptional LysR family regulator
MRWQNESASVARKIDWESKIGRRLKLRDLHVFVTVAQRGSMAKAAEQLGVSSAAVSEVISDLEHTLGLRLLDRHPHGIEPNVYGRALLKRCTTVFDELKQGISDLELLADAAAGEIRIGCSESIAVAILQPIIQQFSELYPRIVLNVCHESAPLLGLQQLRERSLDLCVSRLRKLPADDQSDLSVEVLFNDDTVIAAGQQSRWASRRTLDITEMAGESWILTPPDSLTYQVVVDAFRARDIDPPKARLMTYSVHLRTTLAASGDFVTVLPGSVLRFNASQFGLKALPIALPVTPWPVAVVTLKNRTLNPVAQRFVDHVRTLTRTMSTQSPSSEKKSA